VTIVSEQYIYIFLGEPKIMSDRFDSHRCTRRTVLTTSGTAATAALAGCTVDGGSAAADADSIDELEPISADNYPVVDRWLGTDEVGGVDDTYDGTIVDARGVENPEITVGAEGNGGPVAFEPSAVIVSPETVVKWVWTAHGHHNVVSDPDAQLGESDRSFSSGDIVEQENNLYTEVFEEPGTVLYHCEPHLDLGMKGALIIES